MSASRVAFGVAVLVALAGCNQAKQEVCDFGCGLTWSQSGPPGASLIQNSDGSELSLDFGPVPIGASAVEVLLLSNGSPSDLNFLKVTEMPDPDFSTDLVAGPTALSGGTPVPATFRFAPKSVGAKQAKIVLTTDWSIVPTIEFTLTGQGT